MSNGRWIQSASDTKISFEDPDPESIRIEDIALALSRTCRFSGHTKNFYSVAQHSVLAATVASSPNVAMYALLHDAHEAYTGDIPQPLKGMLNGVVYIEGKLQRAIYKSLGMTWPSTEEAFEVTKIDRRLLVTENRQLFNKNLWDFDIEGYNNLEIRGWDMDLARDNFLRMYDMLQLQEEWEK